MEDDVKRIWWLIITLAIVALIGECIIKPICTSIRAQKSVIESTPYTYP